MNIVLLVGSLDRYSGGWGPFCHGLEKYWPDCPYPVYFITNELDAPCGISLKVGGDRDFSGNTRRALECIDGATTILWMQEEHWLYEPVDTAAIVEFGHIVEQGGADHIRLISGWVRNIRKKCTYVPDPRLSIFTDDSAYRVTAQAAFWNVEMFKSILQPNESVWQFENDGSVRSQVYPDRFLCITENKYMHYVMPTKDKTWDSPYSDSPVTKGRWGFGARKYAKDEEIEVDFSVDPRDAVRPCDTIDEETLDYDYNDKYYRQRKTKRRPFGVIPNLARCLADELGPFASALDLGAGTGHYSLTLADLGIDTWAIDISEYAPIFEQDSIHALCEDLQEPLDLERTFDLVLCIEMAEHLPESAADILCDTVVSHASNVIVFTAAPPGQGGTGHINCQPPNYWLAKLRMRGLHYLPEETARIKEKWLEICGGKFAYLARNISIYEKGG